MKGMYHYLREAWKKPDEKVLRERMIEWRRTDSITKVDKPLRLDRARNLGYKAKKGFVIVRIRLKRGGRKRPTRKKGRRSKRQAIRKVLKMDYKWVAEARVARKFPNLEVLNSYKIGRDGIHYFYEIILVDPQRPEIKNDKTINWICKPANRNRVFRGLTSSGKKSRGLTSRSPTNRNRPSVTSGQGRGK
jgi:large subunit ribosomal protein L15e